MASSTDTFIQISESIQSKMLDPVQGSGSLIDTLRQIFGAPGLNPGGDTSGACASIALHIITAILYAEMVFIGVRLVLGQTFVEQLTLFTKTLFIAMIVIVWQWPQTAIRYAKDDLKVAGQSLGKEFVKKNSRLTNNPNYVISENPIKYWGLWLGDPKDFRSMYNVKNIMAMFNEIPPEIAKNQDLRAWAIEEESEDLKFITRHEAKDSLQWVLSYMNGWTDINNEPSDSQFNPETGLFSNLSKGLTVESLIAVLMPFMVLGMMLTAIMAQMGGYIAPVFTQVAILVGSEVLLEFTLAFGLITLPLMFFKKFNDIWFNYLVFCAGLALVPFFYYVFSGIGFAFSTLAFDSIIGKPMGGSDVAPPTFYAINGNEANNLPIVFKNALKSGIENMLPGLFGMLGNTFNSIGMPIIYWFVSLFEKLFFFVGGTVIVTTFVAGGVGFATIAPAIAKEWHKAFANEEMMKKIQEFFTGIQGSVGSAVGQAYGQAVSSGSNTMTGFARGLFGSSGQ